MAHLSAAARGSARLRRLGLNLSAPQRVFAGFFLYAFGMGGIFPRLGELQRAMAVGEGALGLALIGAACGTLLSLSLAGPLVERVGHRRALLVLLPALPFFYALAGLAGGPLAMFLCLVPAGLCMGAIELVVNLEADRVEHQGGRRIMNRAHAFWSIGFFSAGLVGALAARWAIAPALQLAVMVPLSLGLCALLLGRFDAAPQRSGAPALAQPRLVRPTRAIGALVLMTLSALVLEGAGFDWSAIYMRDAFAANPFVGALAVTVGAMMQALTRYLADPFVERHGARAVARTLLAVLGLGDLLVSFAPAPALALLGFGLMGVGSSVLFPLAMSAAAQRSDRPAAANVAALAQIAFVSFLLAPPLLGLAAEQLGIRWAFGLVLPLVLLSLASCGALAPAPAAPKR